MFIERLKRLEVALRSSAVVTLRRDCGLVYRDTKGALGMEMAVLMPVKTGERREKEKGEGNEKYRCLAFTEHAYSLGSAGRKVKQEVKKRDSRRW